MHWPKSDGYRFVDPDLGRIGVESIKKACWWGSSTSKHTAPRRTCSECRFSKKFSTEGTDKADEAAKEGAMLDGGPVAQVRAITVQQERKGGSCSFAVCGASFHCLQCCEGLKPKPTEKNALFAIKKVEAKKHRCMRCRRSNLKIKCQGNVRVQSGSVGMEQTRSVVVPAGRHLGRWWAAFHFCCEARVVSVACCAILGSDWEIWLLFFFPPTHDLGSLRWTAGIQPHRR